MLKRAASRKRRGITLLELVAAMVVAGVVLAIVGNIALRQQRFFGALIEDAALAGQLRDAASMLPMDVRGASVADGDLREASDTSIEVRETIAGGVICDTLGSTIVLAPAAAGSGAFAAFGAAVGSGDTAWVLSSADSQGWKGYRVTAVASTRGGQCLPGGPQLAGPALVAPRTTLSLDSAPPAATLVGIPARFTRPIRYSVYRASDGNWYLGARDWNSTSVRFNTVQPIAGPFQAPAPTAPPFRWFDTTGSRLATPVGSPIHVALLRIDLRGQTRDVDRILGSAQNTGAHRDSISIAVAVRNRP